MIDIVYPHGRMTINEEKFFPTNMNRLKKLLKIVRMDFLHREEIMRTMYNHITNAILSENESSKYFANRTFDCKQKAADWKNIVESRKMPNGLPIDKEGLEHAKKQLKTWKWDAHTWEMSFNKSQRDIALLKKNLAYLEEVQNENI